jgi:hypothetical protein
MDKFSLIILLFVAWTSWGQGDKIVVNETELEVSRDRYPYFKFDSSVTTLTEVWLAYLNEIGQYYRDSLSTKQFHYIELTPTLTKQEYEYDPELGTNRLNVIVNILKTNYGLKNKDIKIVQAEISSDQGGVGFRILHRNKRELTRKQRQEQKRDEKNRHVNEDQYFEEQ